MKLIGIVGSYTNIVDFKEKLLNQISINIRQLLNGGSHNNISTPEEVHEKSKEIKKIIKSGKDIHGRL